MSIESQSWSLPEPPADTYPAELISGAKEFSDVAVVILGPNDQMPTAGAGSGMKLADLRGADYEDSRWDTLLDQLSVQDMLNMISLCGYQTPAVESVGKVQTNDADGPAAINNNFSGAGSIGFPVATVIACPWNQELAQDYGRIMGQMARELDVAGWYAPGMNLHLAFYLY